MQLLASASTLPDILALVEKFYCYSTKHLWQRSDNEWSVLRSDGSLIPGVRVILRRGRYRFEHYEAK